MNFILLPKPYSDNFAEQVRELNLKINDIIDNGIHQFELIHIGGILTIWYENPKQRDGINENLAVNLNLKNHNWFKIIEKF